MYPASRLRYCYMFRPEDGLLLHVAVQPAPLLLHVPPEDGLLLLRDCYMFLPEDGLPLHVPGQPAPLLLHVPPRGRPTATCSRPTGSATATCSSSRTAYRYMYPASRLRYCYMFLPENVLLRHVPPAGLASAVCPCVRYE